MERTRMVSSRLKEVSNFSAILNVIVGNEILWAGIMYHGGIILKNMEIDKFDCKLSFFLMQKMINEVITYFI